MDYKNYYNKIFDLFGYPLDDSTSMEESVITHASQSYDTGIPVALRDFYLVAGCEKRFSQCYNHLITPKNWIIDKDQIVFMEENQGVVLWSVSINGGDDPLVFQSINDNEMEWFPENCKFSVFIAVMLHYQAVNGGFDCIGNFSEHVELNKMLKEKWTCYGTVNGLIAYSRQNQVLCIDTHG